VIASIKTLESAVKVAGYRLSNMAYNWSQCPGYVLTASDCANLADLVKAWDVATSALEKRKRGRRHAKPPEPSR
jgi:hypothetical protein